MGGIYGLGKTVLWKHSRHRIVLFHSRLQTPYVSKEIPGEHWSRFFGQIRLPGHNIQQQSFQGEAFWGRRKDQLTWSLMDELTLSHEKANIIHMKRTNLVIREELLEEATRLSGERTYSRTVERALEDFVRRIKARRILELTGSGLWEGNIQEMRADYASETPKRQKRVSRR